MTDEPVALSVVIPIYNEEVVVEQSLTALAESLTPRFTRFEIIAVDDGSTDATSAILARLAARLPMLRVQTHARNRGLGAALRLGFRAVRGELVFYTDADQPISYDEIPRAVALLEAHAADAVIGYRLDRAGEPRHRQLYSVVYNLLVAGLYRTGVRDVNFACKLLRRDLLQRLELRAEGSFIDAELLIRAQRVGARIVEMGVHYRPRPHHRSALARPAVIASTLREVLAALPELGRRARRP